MKLRPFFLPLIVFLYLPSVGQDLDEILESCYRKHGGIDNWMSVQTLEYSFVMKTRKDLINPKKNSLVNFSNRQGHVYRAKHDDLIYRNSIFVEENGDSISMAVNETHDWIHKKGLVPIIFSSNTSDKLKSEKIGDPPFLAMHPKILDGITTISAFNGDSRKCYRIRISPPEFETVYYINIETFLIEGFANDAEDNLTTYSDYRLIEGLLFPFRSITYKNSVEVAEINITSITINPQFSKDLFRMPINKDIVVSKKQY